MAKFGMLFQIALQLAITSSVLAASTNTAVTSILGQGFYLANNDLLSDFIDGAQIFESLPASCKEVKPRPETKQVSSFFETSSSFYSYVSAKVGVSASLEGKYTMGTTLSLSSEAISGSSLLTRGLSLDIYALKDTSVLRKICQNTHPLSKTFLIDFRNLPAAQIADPNNLNNWILYDTFLKKFGSHLVQEINQGVRLQELVFSKLSSQYVQNYFQIRACVNLASNTGSLKLDVCGNYSKAEIHRVMQMSMSGTLLLRGGTQKTRAKLRNVRTAALIQQFLVEADTSPGNVLYKWISIWDLLKQRNIVGDNDDFARALNLEAYYKGLLDFGCSYQVENGLPLRWLRATGTPTSPEYDCVVAAEGCRGDSDCHLGGAGSVCFCYGKECVDSRAVNLPNSKATVERFIRTSETGGHSDGINNSCYYKFIAHCDCNTDWGGSATTIWPPPGLLEEEICD